MHGDYGVQDLKNVTIRASQEMKIGSKVFKVGEPILKFPSAQIATTDAVQTTQTASGGKGNIGQVFWESTKEVHFRLQNGVVSPLSLAIMANANLIEGNEELREVEIPIYVEAIPSTSGTIILSKEPMEWMPLFVYDLSSNALVEHTYSDGKLTVDPALEKVGIDYYYKYPKPYQTIEIGEKLFNGFVRLEGTTTFVDSTTGLKQTAVFIMPRARISSSFNFRLGKRVEPIVSTINIIGYPTRTEPSYTMTILDDNINGDF